MAYTFASQLGQVITDGLIDSGRRRNVAARIHDVVDVVAVRVVIQLGLMILFERAGRHARVGRSLSLLEGLPGSNRITTHAVAKKKRNGK